MQTKPKPKYFRQYRNPGQDTSGENGTYGHPILTLLSFWVNFAKIMIFYFFLTQEVHKLRSVRPVINQFQKEIQKLY